MSEVESRQHTWNNIDQKWDIVIIGGGITGAGIFNYAARKGLKVLLLEAADFAFGTSSRSSKLVHGGIRYLKTREYDIVRELTREREFMIKEAPGLVNKMAFLCPGFSTDRRMHQLMIYGTFLYDILVPKWEHSQFTAKRILRKDPIIRSDTLLGGHQYFDATVDDSRLVVRVIEEGIIHGGTALNYCKVTRLLKDQKGIVVGVGAEDQTPENLGATFEVQAPVVINATGPWSDIVRKEIKGNPRLHLQRGSHLLFSHERIPLSRSLAIRHPKDRRAMFVVPWEGTTFIGTTDDLSHLEPETRITAEEVDYLLDAANYMFPGLKLTCEDIISTIAGLRPLIGDGADTPSKVSRKHLVWEEDGLTTISGGKLTIFRIMAADCLNFVSGKLPGNPHFNHRDLIFDPQPEKPLDSSISELSWYYLAGRHGIDAVELVKNAEPGTLDVIDSTTNLWAELAWSAKCDHVVHLDDLLLRRIRLGLYLKNGAMDQIEKIKSLVQPNLNWDEQRWQMEIGRYKEIWNKYYYLP